LHGLAHHIANAILLKKKLDVGTANDLKHVIGHLIRAYQARYIRQNGRTILATAAAYDAAQKGETYLTEHAIPIHAIMGAIFHSISDHDLAGAAQVVRDVIEQSTFLAYVTRTEDAKLNKSYPDVMPEKFDKYPWLDPWARYRMTPSVGIPTEPLAFPRKRRRRAATTSAPVQTEPV
jgi:hypothetical protein